MKSIVLILGVICSAIHGFASQPPNTTRRCRTYVDPVLHVQFPTAIGNLRMATRTTYQTGDYDYGIRYNSDESADLEFGGRHLDLYVYTRDGKLMPDGMNEKVVEQLKEAEEEIELAAKRGYYVKLKRLGMIVEGKLRKTGLKYMWFSNTMKFQERGKSHMSITLMFAWRNRFIKLRYSEPILDGKIEPCEVLPDSFLRIVDVVDDLIVKAEAASKVDVYAIADPKRALEALRQKWLGIEDRISPYDMPDYAERFFELDRTQDWCNEDIEKRAGVFLNVALDGIALKIEPPIWYYNYACALARLGKTDDAIQALEQAIVSGYNEPDHAKEDKDFDRLHGDSRFKKLIAMCGEIKDGWRSPKENAKIENGEIRLNEDNIYWGFNDASYLVNVAGATSNTLIYLDHNAEHRFKPSNDMINVEYSEELQDLGRASGAANFNFVNTETHRYIPTILGCSAVYRENRTNYVHSVPARMWGSSDASQNEARHLYMNVLGVYGIGTDYAADEVDRIFGWSPVALVYYDNDTPDELVRICDEAWRAMNPSVRAKGGVRQLLGIVRRAQKCVKSENDFMSSLAQRPAFSVEDIDEDKVLDLASKLDKPYPEIPAIARAEMGFEVTPITDLWNPPYDRPIACRSIHHAVYIARWAEKTGKLVVMVRRDLGELVWKTLQGDVSKVRFTKKDSVKEGEDEFDVMEIACDYQEAFDVSLPNGMKMRSTRVDVGCFRVVDGVASMPAIVSVFYMPAEKREYGDDGILKTIDYTKPQIPGWMPHFCPKANFKDSFLWTEDGKCIGWMRTDSEGQQTEFTRDGLVVMTRDKLGRPLDVRRSLNMEWLQRLNPFVTTGSEYSVQRSSFGISYDGNKSSPQETTLAWKYVYEDDNDIFGKPSPKDAMRFVYRPELCYRANISEESGFRLPLISQMMLGEYMYSKYKYGSFGNGSPDWELPNDYLRSDSRYALKEHNLEPPAKLKKMQFCPWAQSSNDLWKIDMASHEEWSSERLYELADGVYRSYIPPKDGEEDGAFASVSETYISRNIVAEADAYLKLDESYRRCEKQEIRKILDSRMSADDWRATLITERNPVFEDLPDGVSLVLAMWQLADDTYIGILADHNTGFKIRKYFFTVVDANKKSLTFDYFDELPSRAIGNAVLGAHQGNAEALNNFAVLFYCGIANPSDYDENAVITLLRRSARLGCSAAIYNLGVLYYNRGEKDKADKLFQRAENSGYDFVDDEDVEALARSAEKGNAESQYLLGRRYVEGVGVETNVNKGIELLQNSATQKCASSLVYLGDLFYYGESVTKNYETAMKYYRLAADLGDDYAEFKIGLEYLDGNAVTTNYYEAAKWFKRASDHGSTGAMYLLARLYSGLSIGERNYKRAAELYAKAADLGHAPSIGMLGSLYSLGWGVTKDKKKAVSLWAVAARDGDTDAMASLGSAYRDGNGIEKDDKAAFSWLRQAAAKGDVNSICMAGLMYYLGEGVERDEAMATRYFGRARQQIENQDGEYDSNDYTSLAVMYEYGLGCDADEERALKNYHAAKMWFDKQDETYRKEWVAEDETHDSTGNIEDLLEAAHRYEFGFCTPVDLKKAREYYQKAIDKGFAPAKVSLRRVRAK